jgi:hypothetical protein
MNDKLRLAVIVLGVAPALLAGPAEDKAVLDRHRIQRVAPLFLETPLVLDGRAVAAIAPADDPATNAAATELQAAIAAQTGVTLPIVAAGALTDREWEARNLIIIGNVLTHPAYARLYHNFFVCADAAYTGRGGYELRSVHNPWGHGHNAIVLGAQDAAGFAAGTERLRAEVAAHGRAGRLSLGRLLAVHLNPADRRAPIEARLTPADLAREKELVEANAAKEGAARWSAYTAVKHAMLYHRTGDEGWLELFRLGLERQLDYYAKDKFINEDGPRRYDRDFRDSWAYRMIIAWDLVEEHPSWSEAERLRMANHLLRLVFECNMKNGWDSEAAIARWLAYEGILNNHHTWPALANLFGGWYFSRHYSLPVARTWLAMAQRMFRSASGSAKAWEDASGYDWCVPRHLVTYALASGDRTYLEQGHAAETGRRLLLAIDPLGHQPAWGDDEFVAATAEMPELLCALEGALGDGRYRWAIERLGVDARGEMQEPRWTNARAVRPDELVGLHVSYLPKIHFDMLGRTPDQPVAFRAPNLPFEEHFDKLVVRGGWAKDDDYLMLDGYAAGWHGHFDGNAIISFVSQGAHWLADGEYIGKAPKYHNVVTVQRDNRHETMPTNARLETAAWFGDGALIRTTMPRYNGMSWTRNIVHVAKSYVAVIDELTAEEPGDYSLRCCWRVLGDAALAGDTLSVRQEGGGFALKNLTGQQQEVVYIRNSGEHAYFREPGLPIHRLFQRMTARLKAGETVRFVNVFAAGREGVPAIYAWPTGEGRGAIKVGGRTELFGVGGSSGPIDTDARLYRVTGETAWLAGATRFAAGERRYLQVAAPGTVRLDASGFSIGKSQPVPAPGLRAAVVVEGGKPLPRAFAAATEVAVLARPQPVPVTVPPDAVREAKHLPIAWRFDCRPPPSGSPGELPRLTTMAVCDLNGDGKPDVLVGTSVGDIIAVGHDGREIWRKRLDGPITAVAAGRLAPTDAPLVFFGTDAVTFGVLSHEGTELARTIPPEFRTRASRVRNISLTDLDGDGTAEIVIGCDSWQYMAYKFLPVAKADARLALHWKCVFYAHAATVAHVADLNRDGRPEIVAGNAYYTLQVIGHQGKIVASSASFGPTQTAITSADLGNDGYRAVIVGTDEGDIVAFDVFGHQTPTAKVKGRISDVRGAASAPDVVTAEARARRIWARNAGDRVTSLRADVVAGALQVVAASDSGCVWALDRSGKPVWERGLGAPVKRLVRLGNDYLVATARGVVFLGLDGSLRAVSETSAPVLDLVEHDGAVFAMLADAFLASIPGR